MLVTKRPKLSKAEAEDLAAQLYGIVATAEPLLSERDQNFKLVATDGRRYVLKIAHPDERQGMLEFENVVLDRLSHSTIASLFPRVLPTLDGQILPQLSRAGATPNFVRMISFLPGSVLTKINSPNTALLRDIGSVLGQMDAILDSIRHPAMIRFMQWDAAHAPLVIRENIARIQDSSRRALVENFLSEYERRVAPRLLGLRLGVIHNDMNDHNILVNSDKVSGILDFGDMVYSYKVNDLAIACVYVMLGKDNPLEIASEVVHGYARTYPLTNVEIDVLADFIILRLCLSVCVSAKQQQQEPDNPYLSISERPAWRILEDFAHKDIQEVTQCLTAKLSTGSPARKSVKSVPAVSPLPLGEGPEVREEVSEGCSLTPTPLPEGEGLRERTLPEGEGPKEQTLSRHVPVRDASELLQLRRGLLGRNLSLSYRQPLKIVRGAGQYLYDANGQAYLDCVNNVCHVGHCHPRVVAAGQRQMEILNTNTRYLHDNIVQYASRLVETLPAPLRVCFFVNSGSEANELALRLARAYTGRNDFIVADYAYHGNTQAVIDVSPYKFKRKGGKGKPDSTHIAPIPDVYRGIYKASDPHAGKKYSQEVVSIIDGLKRAERGLAAFLIESIPSCAGQIVLPEGYLKEVFPRVRAAGGVCIADEVQVGFGRVGTHMWAFQTQDVVPDIMTFGKPAGNGHPLAGVVTTPEIATSFANGMEYFNTFGGNPVSCAVGLEVLNVLQEEELSAHALEVGTYLLDMLRQLQVRHPMIGDVRGLGLFLGIELVKDGATLEPATKEADDLVNRMRQRHILLSTDGPFDNVIKIKPPLIFNRQNAEELVEGLDHELRQSV